MSLHSPGGGAGGGGQGVLTTRGVLPIGRCCLLGCVLNTRRECCLLGDVLPTRGCAAY